MHVKGVDDYHLSSWCPKIGALSHPVRHLGSVSFSWSYGMLRAGRSLLRVSETRNGPCPRHMETSLLLGCQARSSCWWGIIFSPWCRRDSAQSLALGPLWRTAPPPVKSEPLWMTVCTHLAPGRWKPFAKMCLVLACIAPQILPLPKNLQERKRGSFSFSFFSSLSPTQLKYSSRHLI